MGPKKKWGGPLWFKDGRKVALLFDLECELKKRWGSSMQWDLLRREGLLGGGKSEEQMCPPEKVLRVQKGEVRLMSRWQKIQGHSNTAGIGRHEICGRRGKEPVRPSTVQRAKALVRTMGR